MEDDVQQLGTDQSGQRAARAVGAWVTAVSARPLWALGLLSLAALLALVGLINLPIIHFSVEWWNTLHQGSTISKLGRPSIDTRMLIPLLIMFAAFNFYFVAAVLNRLRCELLDQERKTQWVRDQMVRIASD